MRVYEVRPRKDRRGFDLVSDALPFGRLWYGEPNAISNAVGYAKLCSRSHDAVIRIYDSAATLLELTSTRAVHSTALLTVQNRLRCGLVHFKLCAHLL
jgi:hypothetical protein